MGGPRGSRLLFVAPRNPGSGAGCRIVIFIAGVRATGRSRRHGQPCLPLIARRGRWTAAVSCGTCYNNPEVTLPLTPATFFGNHHGGGAEVRSPTPRAPRVR